MTIAEVISAGLRRALRYEGINAAKLAERCGVPIRTLKRIKNGYTLPRQNTLDAIARALDREESDIFLMGLDEIKEESKNEQL